MTERHFKEKVIAILHGIIANPNVYNQGLANALNDLYKLLENNTTLIKSNNKIYIFNHHY